MTDNSIRMAGKVCLVTGAGRGIGRSIARAAGHEGGVIALCDIDAARGVQVRDELASEGIVAEFFEADLGAKGEPGRLVGKVIRKFGKLDVLINNARAGKRLSFAEESEDNWDMAFGVNLKAVFFLAQAAIPVMSADGAIVTISSVSGRLVSQEAASYQVSKAGLLQLTRYLATIGGEKGVRVNAVLPGFIVQDEHRARYDSLENTGYRRLVELAHPLRGGPGYSDDIARTVIFLASKEASFITGQELVVDGGLTIQDPASMLLSYALD